MIELRMPIQETRNAAEQPPSSGNRPSGWRVVSKAKITDANMARDAPAKMAAMPTSAPMRGSMPSDGATNAAPAASAAPRPPPSVNSGASVPPEVPEPSEIDQETPFQKISTSMARPARLPDR